MWHLFSAKRRKKHVKMWIKWKRGTLRLSLYRDDFNMLDIQMIVILFLHFDAFEIRIWKWFSSGSFQTSVTTLIFRVLSDVVADIEFQPLSLSPLPFASYCRRHSLNVKYLIEYEHQSTCLMSLYFNMLKMMNLFGGSTCIYCHSDQPADVNRSFCLVRMTNNSLLLRQLIHMNDPLAELLLPWNSNKKNHTKKQELHLNHEICHDYDEIVGNSHAYFFGFWMKKVRKKGIQFKWSASPGAGFFA